MGACNLCIARLNCDENLDITNTVFGVPCMHTENLMHRLVFKCNISDTVVEVCESRFVEQTIDKVRSKHRYVDLVKDECFIGGR